LPPHDPLRAEADGPFRKNIAILKHRNVAQVILADNFVMPVG